MQWIVARMKVLMLVVGVLTCTMFYATIAPEAALRSMFGESLEGELADIVVRNWGALIGLVGAMLIYGAFNPKDRPLILTVAAVSKITFIALVLMKGGQYLGQQVGLAITIDAVIVAIFIVYLFAVRRGHD